jgi:hypothetical protein
MFTVFTSPWCACATLTPVAIAKGLRAQGCCEGADQSRAAQSAGVQTPSADSEPAKPMGARTVRDGVP